LASRYCWFCGSGYGFEDGVGEAVDCRAEAFFVAGVADLEVCGSGPAALGFLFGGGVGSYGAGGAVGDELGVGLDVGD